MVFIDETWIKTNMAPLYGWGPKGKRLRGFAPHGHWRTLTFLGSCAAIGSPPLASSMPRSTGNAFAPTSSSSSFQCSGPATSSSWTISAVVRQLVRAAGARLWFLPPYSPDLNPIEQAFAKINWMRHAQKR